MNKPSPNPRLLMFQVLPGTPANPHQRQIVWPILAMPANHGELCMAEELTPAVLQVSNVVAMGWEMGRPN